MASGMKFCFWMQESVQVILSQNISIKVHLTPILISNLKAYLLTLLKL